MIKGLEALNEMLNMDLGLVRTNRNKKGEDYKIINKELKALAIISKYLAINSITLNLLKYGANKEEIEIVKEVLR